MKYLRYTHVDARTGIPVTEAPARNGPASPNVKGLSFLFALESRYPTTVPVFYGTCDDDADLNLPGVLGEVTAERVLDDVRAERKAAVAAQYDRRVQAGFAYDFGTIAAKFEDGSIGPAGVQVFQMRDLEDKTNWQLALTSANENIAAGGGDIAIVELRMASNALVQCTANQAKAALLALLSWGQGCLARSWALKGHIATAGTVEAVLAVDIGAGWP